MNEQNSKITDEIINKLADAEELIIDAYQLTQDRTLKTLLKIEMHHLETLMFFVEVPG